MKQRLGILPLALWRSWEKARLFPLRSRRAHGADEHCH
jgi:hypothetical protein